MILASRLEWVPSAFTGINPSCITARADSSNITNIRTAPNKTFLTSFSSAHSDLAATTARRTSMKCGGRRQLQRVIQRASWRKLAPKFSTHALNPQRPPTCSDGARPASCAKTDHRAFALLVDAESFIESFSNDHRSRHVLMTVAAEYVT